MTKEIRLTQGKIALVDDEDFEWLNQWRWYYRQGYARRNFYRMPGKGKTILMHRLILKTPDGFETDHVDGDGLNNRRINLRNCLRADNARNVGRTLRNTSGYKGATWHKQCRKWQAQIEINSKSIYLGLYNNAEDAAHAYDTKARELFGKFACVNFQEEF